MEKIIYKRSGEAITILYDKCDSSIIESLHLNLKTSGDGRQYVKCYFKNKNKKLLSLHRVLLRPKKNQVVDHINNNGLDNRRSNLRICNQTQNLMNKLKPKNGVTSNFKGVSLSKNKKMYRARIFFNGKEINLGQYTNEIDAAIAYNKAAKKYFKEYSKANCITK